MTFVLPPILDAANVKEDRIRCTDQSDRATNHSPRRRAKVKHNRWTILVVSLVAVGYFVSQAATQTQQGAAAFPYLVAVVDVAQLIKNHPDFKTKQDALQAEMLRKEADFKQKQEAILKKEQGFAAAGLRAGTEEHEKAVNAIQSEYAEFERDVKAEQRRFALRNSQIMYDTYKDIKAEIQRFATAKGIAQVTDYRMFEPDPAIPQTVAEDMDQKLVWFDTRLDITYNIITQLYAARQLQPPSKEEVAAANVPQRTAAAPAQPVATGIR